MHKYIVDTSLVCESTMGLRRGSWAPEEDKILVAYIQRHGHPNWRTLPQQAGLQRCGKSCRLRWLNYLRPDIKRGSFTREEEGTVIRLHQELGSRWSAIAAHLPGRTDNHIKNVWHTHLKKRLANSSPASESCPTADQRQRKRVRRDNDSSSDATCLASSHIPMAAPSPPQQPCSSPSSSHKSELPLSRNLVESPSSTVTTTTHEFVESSVGATVMDDYLMEETIPRINKYEGWFKTSPLCMGSISMDSKQAQGDPMLLCSKQQDKEEGVDEFWLKLLIEADANQLTIDQLLVS